MAAEWSVSGQYSETCNCEAACPCVVLGPPTEADCTVLVGWHVERGRFDRIALDGLNVALAAYAPGPMTKVKWKVALYVDERATPEQREALTRIFSGQAGGPPAALTALIGEVLGVKSAAIEFRAHGKERGLRIAGVAEYDLEAVPGQGDEEVTLANAPFAVVPNAPAVVARSKRASFRDLGLTLEATGKNGFYSPFEYHP